MENFFSNWNDTVWDLLHTYVEKGEPVEWVLNTHSALPTWVKGKCVLVGDASHPMLPYVAQGAAQGIEDAGALAFVLSKITSRAQIEGALQVFQSVRKERAEKIQASAAETRRVLHLPDGKEQQERDQTMGAARQGTEKQDEEKDGQVNVLNEIATKRNPDLWADEQWQDYVWGVDIMAEASKEWETFIREIEAYQETWQA